MAFPFIFLGLLILATFYFSHPFYWPEKFWSSSLVNHGKDTLIDCRCIHSVLVCLTTNVTPNLIMLFYKPGPNAVNSESTALRNV